MVSFKWNLATFCYKHTFSFKRDDFVTNKSNMVDLFHDLTLRQISRPTMFILLKLSLQLYATIIKRKVNGFILNM